jgi:hypothetical protein
MGRQREILSCTAAVEMRIDIPDKGANQNDRWRSQEDPEPGAIDPTPSARRSVVAGEVQRTTTQCRNPIGAFQYAKRPRRFVFRRG